jgi:hypothetical protein
MQQENLNNNMLKAFPPQTADTKFVFDIIYATAYSLLNQFYPERTIEVTSRGTPYITPGIKAKLRRKNRSMRAGQVEEAGGTGRVHRERLGTSKQESVEDDRRQDGRQRHVGSSAQLTGRKQDTGPVPGISAEPLNSHCVATSTDNHYTPPINKQSNAPSQFQYISLRRVFQILDHLHTTATGLDQLPPWVLRIGAPLFYEPITRLFNLSLSTSTVPLKSKQAFNRPIAKVSTPSQPTDFRPISITPVLTRIMERTVVQRFL